MPRRVSCIPSSDRAFCEAATAELSRIGEGLSLEQVGSTLAGLLRTWYPLVEVHQQERLAQVFLEDVWYAYRDGRPLGGLD